MGLSNDDGGVGGRVAPTLIYNEGDVDRVADGGGVVKSWTIPSGADFGSGDGEELRPLPRRRSKILLKLFGSELTRLPKLKLVGGVGSLATPPLGFLPSLERL